MNLVQVWLLYHHLNFKYSTLFVSETELRTDGRTDGRTDRQTDDPITRCPRRTFQAWGIKIWFQQKGLTTRNTHVKYESPISFVSKVMAKVKFFSKVGQKSRSRLRSKKNWY